MNQLKVLEKSNLDNFLISVSISGVLEPWIKVLDDGCQSEFKLISSDGREYSVISTDSLKNSLSQYAWKDVKAIGILNKSNMTLIAQKIFPRNSNNEMSSIFKLELNKRKDILKKIARKVNDLIIMPIGLLAILVA